MYFNTVPLPKDERIKAKKKANSQEQLVLRLYREGMMLTPAECWEILADKGHISKLTPLQSIRRARSNLKNEGILEKTENYRLGWLGTAQHCYMYSANKQIGLGI